MRYYVCKQNLVTDYRYDIYAVPICTKVERIERRKEGEGGESASEAQEEPSGSGDGLKEWRIRRGMDSFRFSCSVDGGAVLSLLSSARKERGRYEKTTR